MANTKAYKTARDISGVVATRVQGPELTVPLYEKGTSKTVWTRGDLITIGLFRDGGTGTLLGSEYSGSLYKGNGSSGYLRGSSVKARTGMYKYSGALYDADGVRVNGSTSYYYGGSEKTLYQGNGSYVHDRGDSVSDTLYYAGGTAYLRGSEYEFAAYTTGSRLSYIEQPKDPYAAALFLQDQNSYPGGLHYDIELANFTTRAATLLQA